MERGKQNEKEEPKRLFASTEKKQEKVKKQLKNTSSCPKNRCRILLKNM